MTTWWGLTDLRLAVATQTWHPIGTVATSLPPTDPSRSLSSDPDLEHALGSANGLVVVVGTRAMAPVHRALRLMLGSHSVVVVGEPHTLDLAGTLALARRRTPVVVLVPDAPPGVLDQITPEVRAELSDEVLLVVVTRPSFLEAVSPGATRTLLDTATVRPAIRDEPALSPRLDDFGDLVTAVVRTIADRDRLGVAGALQEPELRALLVAHHSEEPARRDLRAAVAEAVETGLVRWARRAGEDHLAPAPEVMEIADDGGWAISDHFGTILRDQSGAIGKRPETGAVESLVVAARIARARGDRTLTSVLVGRLDPDLVPLEVAEVVAERADEMGQDKASVKWHSSVARRTDPTLARSALRSAGLAAQRLGRLKAARRYLLAAEPAESDREVQDALGRLELEVGDVAAARTRFLLATDGSDDIAAAAALELGQLAVAAKDDAGALIWFDRATGSEVAEVSVPARFGRLHALLRCELFEEADAEGAALEAFRPAAAVGPRYRELQLAWADARRGKGDRTGAYKVLTEIRGHFDVVSDLRVAAALVELRVESGQWKWLADTRHMEWRLLSEKIEREDWQSPVVLSSEEEDAVRRMCAIRGEAAYCYGSHADAREWLERVRPAGDLIGTRTAYFLGALAVDRHDALVAVEYFDRAAHSPDKDVARRARKLAKPLRQRAAQQARRERIREIEAEEAREDQRLAAEVHAQWVAILGTTTPDSPAQLIPSCRAIRPTSGVRWIKRRRRRWIRPDK